MVAFLLALHKRTDGALSFRRHARRLKNSITKTLKVTTTAQLKRSGIAPDICNVTGVNRQHRLTAASSTVATHFVYYLLRSSCHQLMAGP